MRKTIGLVMLTKELNERVRSKEKSIESYNAGRITKALHETHMRNLNKIIIELNSDIDKLKQ